MTSTFITGLRHGGIVAPCLFNCATDGELFLAYVEQQLAPSPVPGDIVTADTLSSHKVAGVREAIEARGASLWFLSSYSPILIRSSRPLPSSGNCCEGSTPHCRGAAVRSRPSIAPLCDRIRFVRRRDESTT